MSTDLDIRETYARARQTPILDLIEQRGGRLYRQGRRLRGPCPLCGHSAKKRGDGCFSVDPAAEVFFCHSCSKGGDVIALVVELERLKPLEAALWLLKEDRPKSTNVVRLPATRSMADGETGNDRIARDLLAQSRPAFDSPVRNYLASRGLVGPVVDMALRQLRFHPGAFWGVEDGVAIRMPAMIAPLAGAPGIHVTYLNKDGRGKTTRPSAKKMWGRQVMADGRTAACWLIGPDGAFADAPLLTGEGLESTVAAGILVGRPVRLAATLSLRALQGGILPDNWGRIDPASPVADPERPPWTHPGEREVMIAVDRDMKPLKAKLRKACGGTYERDLTADERARICAGLAEQAWRRAGTPVVRCLAPAAGRDFNDELIARRAVSA